MKSRYLLLSFIILAAGSVFNSDAATVKFAKSSRLNSGNWVKIGVEKSGVYEISYQTLREMGFDNPENVGLYGRGGIQESLNFLSAGGSVLYKDDLAMVPVIHHGDKIYFYGQGTEDIGLILSSAKYEGGGYFSRKSKNIYADRGYYFLSDQGGTLAMSQNQSANLDALKEVTSGISFLAHENDLVQNHSMTGQLFFGEKTTPENPRLQWEVYLPGAMDNKQGAMECYYYIDRNVTPELSYGLEGTTDYISTIITTPTTTNYTPVEPKVGPTTVPGTDATVFVNCDPAANTQISNVDYWTLTYQRTAPELIGENGKRLSQDFIAYPLLERNRSAKVRLPGGASHLVIDISRPATPVQIMASEDGADAWIKISNSSYVPQLIVFDPMMPQMQISGYQQNYTKIANQDLHARLAEGADLIIICIPALKESAERLADLHRIHDNMRVVVATTDECYNEFSSGVPDPMAYRAAVKMAYATPYSCKNLLLMGPLFGDFRGVQTEKEPESGIIAYQATPMNQLRGAQNANSFYGIMSDYISTNLMENTKVAVGVGVLPVRYPAEAATVIDKIERHITNDNPEYYLNFYTAIGGVGDNHTHDNQAKRSSTYLADLNYYSSICNTLVIDAYGFKDAQRRFFKDLNSGRFLVSYFGHGAEYTLNQTGDFFYASDVYKLRNTVTPIMFFAGCQISNSDRGIRGLGESLITSTPYGLLGSILATRETWSSQNEDLVKFFYKNMFKSGVSTSSDPHPAPLTIGEVWARTLTESTYNNELAYQLMCDPAIIIPIVTRPTQTDQEIYESPAGDFLEFTARVPVSHEDLTTDKSYNGTAVIRLMEPIKTIVSADVCTANDPTTSHDLKVLYADTQLSMTTAEIINGEFTVRLYVPEAAREFAGKTGRIHIATYSPDQKIASGNMFGLTFLDPGDDPTRETDTEDPVITRFEYNPRTLAIEIAASDNTALSFSDSPLKPAFRLSIDGKDFGIASVIQPVIMNYGAEMSKIIPITDLPEGTHSARVLVADANGNTATAEITFDYLPNSAPLTIRMKESAVSDSATFEVCGIQPDAADIIILNNQGFIIRRDTFNGGSYVWDACDNAGTRVEKGLYKAYILETGKKSGKRHSSAIAVPVI